MAAMERLESMYDPYLKPKLLRRLLREYVPDQKRPFRNHSSLMCVVYDVKMHQLLSEAYGPAADSKLTEDWKSAFDKWVDRLINLISSDMLDKCWAGICLLGVTCEECSCDRFLASYAFWYSKLLLLVQAPCDSDFVKVASCSSMSDLFTRLSGFPNIKKDATLLASRLIQPVLKLLNEDSSDDTLEGALSLLCTVITYFPSSLHQHFDSAEAAIVSKIKSGKCSVNMLKKLGHCLALLPESKGDGDSWSLMIRKILLFINAHLNDAFQGLKEEGKHNEVVRLLPPIGKDHPPPLGGQTTLGKTSDQEVKRPEELLISSISTMMFCCCTMLTNSHPFQVVVPVRALIVLIERVLMVDGSLSQALFLMPVMPQEFICSKLLELHSCGFELLTAVVKATQSQLLPFVADIVRLLTNYIRKCLDPNLRVKVYHTINILLMSFGVGIGIYLVEEIVDNVCIDLDFNGYERDDSSINPKVSSEELTQPAVQKRKRTSSSEQLERFDMEHEKCQNVNLLSLKIAALQALEILLIKSGLPRPQSLRSKVVFRLMSMARYACKGGLAEDQPNIFLMSDCTPTWADFQLAAFRALLAYLLSHDDIQSPYLAQSLDLFRRGEKEVGTKLAEFCAHALSTLRVLIRPRAFLLVDFSSMSNNLLNGAGSRFPDRVYSNDYRQNTTSTSNTSGMRFGEAVSYHDDLCESWITTGEEIEVLAVDPVNNESIHAEKPSRETEPGVSTADAAKKIKEIGDLVMIESQHHEDQESNNPPEVQIPIIGGKDGGFSCAQSDKGDSNVALLDGRENGMPSREDLFTTKSGGLIIKEKSPGLVLEKDALATKDDNEFTTSFEKISNTSNLELSNGFRVEPLDNDSSMDDFPDIVDGDPDSD